MTIASVNDAPSLTTMGKTVAVGPRDHRRATGLTQEELAERAGVSPRSISEMERGGAHVPRRDTVALLASALELEAAEPRRSRRSPTSGGGTRSSVSGQCNPSRQTQHDAR